MSTLTAAPIQVAFIGECMIELSHSDPSTLKMGFAGDTLNSAVYFSRLTDSSKISTTYITALGADAYSENMIHAWRDENIIVDLVRRIPEKLPGLYIIKNNEEGERTFYFYRSQSAARDMFKGGEGEELCDKLLDFDYLFFSSILLAILDETQRVKFFEVIKKAKKKGIQVCFDINFRLSLWPDLAIAKTLIEQALSLADIALPSMEDLELIFGKGDLQKFAAAIRNDGVKELVIKQGAKGYFLSSQDTEEFVNIIPQKNVIDTTGAGDSFNGAYLAGRLQGLDMKKAAQQAAQLAATVIQYRGAIIPRGIGT